MFYTPFVVSLLTLGSFHGIKEPAHHLFITTDSTSESLYAERRLTINPHKDATATENKEAGTKALDQFPGYFVHVPKSAVGKKRVPLVVMLHGGGRNGEMEVEKFKGLSEKYGMILLTPSSNTDGRWDVINGIMTGGVAIQDTREGFKLGAKYTLPDIPRIDSALKYVLGSYAIDPDRIALLGFSDGGSYTYFLGCRNQKVFSRIVPLSPMIPFACDLNDSSKAEMLISAGYGEGIAVNMVLNRTALLQSRGHSVKTQIGIRGHIDNVEDENHVWNWLKTSWDPTDAGSIKQPNDNASKLLTVENLDKLEKFWTEFGKLPDSLKREARMAHQKEYLLNIGDMPSSVVMMDLESMEKSYNKIREILKEAGLTAEEAAEWRKSVVEVAFTQRMEERRRSEKNKYNSNLVKNIELLKAHSEKFSALTSLGIMTVQ